MQTFTPVPCTARVEVFMRANGKLFSNVVHVTGAAPLTQIDVTTIGAVMVTNWTSAIMPSLSMACAAEHVVVTALDSETAPQEDVPFPGGVQGGVGGDISTSNVAFCVKHLTAVRGRSYRGRSYIGGLANASIVGDNVISDIAGALAAGFQSLAEALQAAGYVLSVVSYWLNLVRRATGVATPIVASSYTDTQVDTRRRRMYVASN